MEWDPETKQRFEQVVKSVVDLVATTVVKQTDIYSAVQEGLVARSAGFTVVVLYNRAYGGFDYTNSFGAYCREQVLPADKHLTDSRITDVRLVRLFGKMVAARHPKVAKIASWQDKPENNLGFSGAQLQLKRKRHRKNLLDARARADAAQGMGFSSKVPSVGDVLRKRSWASLDDLNASALVTIKAALEKAWDKEKVKDEPLQLGEDIVRVLETVERIKSYLSDEDRREAFGDLLVKLETGDGEAWVQQDKLCPHTGLYLLEHPELLEKTTLDEDMVMKLGLMAASSTYCDLTIAKIPAGCGWNIEEYDGMETVRLL